MSETPTATPLTSRELEIEQVRRAIKRADMRILHLAIALENLRLGQIARHRELVRQETLAKCLKPKS